METSTPTGQRSRPGPDRPPLRRAPGTPIAGVSLGVARHLGFPVPLVRVAFIVLTITGGAGLLLYCWLWVFVPSEQEPVPDAARRGLSGPAVQEPESTAHHGTSAESENPEAATSAAAGRVQRGLDSLTSSPEVLVGFLLLGVGALMFGQLVGLGVNWRVVVVPAIILGGIILAWSQIDKTHPDRSHTDRGQPPGTAARRNALWQVGFGAALVLSAMLIVAGGMVGTGELITGIIVAAMLIAGLALVLAPWVIKLYRTSQTERARAAAEAERADIAAHLHDSVLQTLAMIQKQKNDPAAVERLARSQERQLRSWLYRQNAAASGTLKDQIMAVAAELEEMHSVPVEVVAVGESRGTDHQPLVAAAREAILNAIKHAGPTSVYIESTAAEDAVFIRDRGPGFDLDGIAEDRMGLRESIIGRMQRAGGSARIRSNTNGTEVQLFLPVEGPSTQETPGAKSAPSPHQSP
ncbi:PspC domain-containing protein [Nesterenkonia sp. MY13]|uniref:PspC domain-containing protein n=1 Tax=Nesterenkonia sedimenti TaxID=1463632 RepID=A0A7X8TIM9_9MICC|nr:ATP-binding protein [Nesterenkonia sedimenti]NLS09032.1 PspC domain-containing protein [Nesterenkonia sedimenti]